MERRPPKPVPFLLNPLAGRRGGASYKELQRIQNLEHARFDLEPVAGGRLREAAGRLARAGQETIGVCGGDGSIAAVAGELAGSDVALLPVPTGTLNHFARRVGISDIDAALAALSAGRVESLPVGILDDHIFLNTATFGVYADVVRRRERLRPFLSKWPAAAVSFLTLLREFRPMDVVIQVEGKPSRRSTALLWVGIGWGSFPRVLSAPERRSSPDLEVVVLHSRTRLGTMALLVRLVRHLLHGRRPIHDPALEVIHGRNLVIHAPHRIGVTLDGEVLRLDPPLFVAVQDEGIRVVCGPPE